MSKGKGVQTNKNDPGPYEGGPVYPEGHNFERQVQNIQLESKESSISLIKNTKGVNVGVKVYDKDPLKAQRVAVAIFDELDKKYSQVE